MVLCGSSNKSSSAATERTALTSACAPPVTAVPALADDSSSGRDNHRPTIRLGETSPAPLSASWKRPAHHHLVKSLFLLCGHVVLHECKCVCQNLSPKDARVLNIPDAKTRLSDRKIVSVGRGRQVHEEPFVMCMTGILSPLRRMRRAVPEPAMIRCGCASVPLPAVLCC